MSKLSNTVSMTTEINDCRAAYRKLHNKISNINPIILEQLQNESPWLTSLMASFQKGVWLETNDLPMAIEKLESCITTIDNRQRMCSKPQFFSTGARGVVTSVSPEATPKESNRKRFWGIK